MRLVGMHPVVVHGGGPQITDLMRRLGKEPEFVDGLRVTDAETVDIVRMALVGKVNREIVSALNRHGSYAVGLSGEDAGPHPRRDPRPRSASSATSSTIDPAILERLLREDLIPVVATIGVDDDGQAYNINADTVGRRRSPRRSAPRSSSTSPTSPACTRTSATRRQLISQIDVAGMERLLADGQGRRGDDPEAAVVHRRAATMASAAPTSSTAACRTRCCSSSSPAKASAP